MIGYGIILPLEEALTTYAKNLGRTTKDFVIETVNKLYMGRGDDPLNDEELTKANENIIAFWFDNGQDIDFIPDDEIHMRVVLRKAYEGIAWKNDPNINVFIGFILKLRKDTLGLDQVKKEIDESEVNKKLEEYGFDKTKAKYYFTGTKEFTI
jgi:hypothetical protein